MEIKVSGYYTGHFTLVVHLSKGGLKETTTAFPVTTQIPTTKYWFDFF